MNSIEEKATRYDEAKYIMKEYLESGNAGVIAENTIKKAFPEFAESEDERIRKEIRNFIFNYPEYLIERDSWLAWLEKQSKDSPVLSNSSNIGKVEQKPAFEIKTPEESLGIDSGTYSKIVDECIYGEPKQEWSKEDKEIIDYLIDYLESELDSSYTDLDKETFTKEINWLKSLRPQSQWKPSDEQMEYLAKAIFTLGDEGNCKTASILNDLRLELKKLREK